MSLYVLVIMNLEGPVARNSNLRYLQVFRYRKLPIYLGHFAWQFSWDTNHWAVIPVNTHVFQDHIEWHHICGPPPLPFAHVQLAHAHTSLLNNCRYKPVCRRGVYLYFACRCTMSVFGECVVVTRRAWKLTRYMAVIQLCWAKYQAFSIAKGATVGDRGLSVEIVKSKTDRTTCITV